MPRAVGDPDSIRQLASKVHKASADIDVSARSLVGALKGTDWSDPVQKRFEQDLNELVKYVKAFKARADVAERHLQKKARELDEYLRG